MCVCVLKKDDIFINWSLWTIVGSIILPKPLIEYGLSSNQIRTNDVRNVVLLVAVPRAYTIISFGLTNTNTLFTQWWKSSDMEILMSCCWAQQQHLVSSMIHVEHQASVGNFYKHYLRDPFVKHMFGCKKWLPLAHVHLMQVAVVDLRKSMLLPLESSQISHAHVRSIL